MKVWCHSAVHTVTRSSLEEQLRFELWFLCSTVRYLLHEEAYCGKNTDFTETESGRSYNVAFGMIENCGLTEMSTVAMDNFCIKLPLLDKTDGHGYVWYSTIWENGLQGAPLEKNGTLLNETRGKFGYTSDRNSLLVVRRDNKVLINPTIYLLLNPILSTKCLLKAQISM